MFNFVDVLLIAVVAIFCLIVPVIGLVLFLAVRGFQDSYAKQILENVLVLVPLQTSGYVLAVGFMVFWISQKYRTRFLTAIRWNRPMGKLAWRAIGLGIALGIASGVLTGLLQRWMPKSAPIEQYFKTQASAYMMVGFGILVAPLVEELFFRGLLYPVLARPLGVFWAAALTALGFAGIHLPQLGFSWAAFVILLTVSSVLTAARVVTKSVAFCVLIHIAYNFTLFTSFFVVTQGFRHMERA